MVLEKSAPLLPRVSKRVAPDVKAGPRTFALPYTPLFNSDEDAAGESENPPPLLAGKGNAGLLIFEEYFDTLLPSDGIGGGFKEGSRHGWMRVEPRLAINSSKVEKRSPPVSRNLCKNVVFLSKKGAMTNYRIKE